LKNLESQIIAECISGKWLAFKKSKGIVPPPAFVCEASQFATVAAATLVATHIVDAAIKNTKSLLDRDKCDYSGCDNIVKDDRIYSFLVAEVSRFATGLKVERYFGRSDTEYN
jgi:hypothetical protein